MGIVLPFTPRPKDAASVPVVRRDEVVMFMGIRYKCSAFLLRAPDGKPKRKV